MELYPLNFKEAKEYIGKHHRHHLPPHGWKFGVAAKVNGEIVGVVTVGRPIARHFDNGLTAEVTRLCTDGTKNACSMLYGAARRAAFAMGYRRIITYVLESESGLSLKASGWKFVGLAGGSPWNHKGRERADAHPQCKKKLWESLAA